MASVSYKNICWFDVSMDDAFRVRRFQPVCYANRHVQQLLDFHGQTSDGVFQGFAFQKLHGDKGYTAFLANLVNGADIGMIQRRGCLCLSFKSRQGLCVFGQIVREELQSHEAVELNVLSLVNHAHSASAESFKDAVM